MATAPSDENKDTRPEKAAGNQSEKQDDIDNPNEFRASPSQEKGFSQNVEEKKLVKDVMNVEERNKKELDIKLPQGYSLNISSTFIFLHNP